MGTIYHYCDLNGFLNIIKHKKLWVSAASNLNDHKEVDWFLEKMHKKISLFANDYNRQFIATFFSAIRLNPTIPYICSFSKNGDLLSQWRAYADNGHGIAIGFNREFFGFKDAMPYPNLNPDYATCMSDIIYEDEEQNRLVDEVIELIRPNLEQGFSADASNFNKALVAANYYSYICKNDAFREEDEVRVIHTPWFNMEDKNTSLMGAISELSHRVSGKKLTSYFELDFSESKKSQPIVDIVLGPKCQVGKFDIELFLSTNGLGSIPYRVSRASYR